MEQSPRATLSPGRFRLIVVTGLLGLNLLVITLFLFSLAKSRRQYEVQAAVNAQNLAQVLEQNITGTIDKVDVGIFALAREVERQLAASGIEEGKLSAYLGSVQGALPEIDGLRVTDAQGVLISGVKPTAGAPINVADRDFFIQLRDDPRDHLVVSKPLKGRVAKRWIITLARRINRPDGTFGGVVIGTLPLERIDRLFSFIKVGSHGAFALRDGSDLALVARYPEPEGIGSAVGHKVMSKAFTELLSKGQTIGTYDAPSGLDQRVRTWGFRLFGNRLFYIFVGLAKEEYLAGWRREATIIGLSLATLFLLSVLAAGVADRGWRRNRAVEASLRASDARMRLFFERQIVGMAIASAEGHFIEVNDRWCQITGYSREELTQGTWEDLTHPEDWTEASELFYQLVGGWIEEYTVTKRLTRKDGAVVVVDQSVGCIRNQDGTLNCLIALMEDVTEHRQAEEARHRLEQQLQHAQKLESLGSLAGGVAHDMNNVLGAILGLASAHLEDPPADGRIRHAFETIAKAAHRGGKMVKSLLSLARQSPVEEEQLDLNAILREEVHLLERTTLSRIHLTLDLGKDLKPVLGDASALTNAFMNLCVNAVDAMPADGTLTIRTRNLEDDWVEVAVEDTGCGMPKQVLEKALDPFFTTKAQGKGTGLGLSLVYSTVKAHKGQMELQSELGKGTCVRLRFPVFVPGAAVPETATSTPAQATRRSLQVLLVDDDELIQSSTLAILEVLGHEATLVSSGEEALVRLEGGLRPDLVLLDMNMPGLGGARTLPRLRTLLPTVPVLLTTGRVDQVVRNLIEADAHLTLLAKPYGMKDLRQRFEALDPPARS